MHSPLMVRVENQLKEQCLTKVIGLGGCSLINAGVFLEADEDTLKMSSWPSEIRNDPSVLDDCEAPIFWLTKFLLTNRSRLFACRGNAAAFYIPRRVSKLEQT